MDAIAYYHVELLEHAVLLAEGLPAESYLDAGNRLDFENGEASEGWAPPRPARARPWTLSFK